MVSKSLISIVAGLVVLSAVVAFPGCGNKQDDASIQPTAPVDAAQQQQLDAAASMRAKEAAAKAKNGQQ